MGVSKVNDNVYGDFGYGDIALSFQAGKNCHSFYMEDIKTEGEIGSFVSKEDINIDTPKIVLTFDKHSVDSLDSLIIRLLEFRQAAFGPEPSRF